MTIDLYEQDFWDRQKAKNVDCVDLCAVIGYEVTDDPRYCGTTTYIEWEQEVATPALESLGYTNIIFSDGERDSFGPLSRIVHAHKDGENICMFYG